jgi:diguanylate cyclase (GGDEF)-like protein
MPRFLSSIGARLVAAVLSTGLIAFAVIGGLAMLRLDLGLREQADALGHLSARQLSDRLEGEAQLARARIDAIGFETAVRLRQLAQRADIAKAVASRNDITIRELLATVAKTSGMQRIVAFDADGIPIGVNQPLDLLAINKEVQRSELLPELRSILTNNTRSDPRGHHDIHVLPERLLQVLALPQRLTVAHEALEPVFDDFGDLVGALGSFRVLGRIEPTLENFSTLSNAGVVILSGSEAVSSAGPKATFSNAAYDSHGLIRSDDGSHVGRCADHGSSLKVCTFTDASTVSASRDQMFRIGAAETRSLMRQFLAVAAIALVLLVAALLIGVHRTTSGLSTLASAARAVAAGEIDKPFAATGVGEVYTLGLAFEQMLANLRASMGQIRRLAFHDTTTGLPNREKLRVDAERLVSRLNGGALWFVDLDGFKTINDTFGHSCGDMLLRQVSDRLTQCFESLQRHEGWTEQPIIARVGGDEFVILTPVLRNDDWLIQLSKRVLNLLATPFEINASHVSIGASIGITRFPLDATNYEDLLINADLAMYAAKARGRNTMAIFSADILEKSKERSILEQDLKQAVRSKQLTVFYQPMVSCRDGTVRAVEALVRWKHPALGYVAPERFIPIAEDIGLVQEIDRFVLERALRDIRGLVGAEIVVAVNVSAAGFEDPFLVNEVARLLREADFPPHRLELEITETVAMRDPELVRKTIVGLRALGTRLAIDDFGAGYSNLATLARLPFDTVKLDRSLIANLDRDREKQCIVRAALSLAVELGFDTVVEGIERWEELEVAVSCGATYAQGYLFSEPKPIVEVATLLQPGRLRALIPSEAEPPRRASA